MHDEITRYLCCPHDGKDLDIRDDGVACRGCGRKYPLINGVLSMMPDDFVLAGDRTAELKRIEQNTRDQQAEVYLNWFGPYTNAMEYDFITGYLRPRSDDVLADLGSGIGRYTVPLSSLCKGIIAVDYSLTSLFIMKREMERRGITNIYPIQADLCRLPLRAATFDKIVCSQVLTFLPGEESRNTACKMMDEILKPEGRMVLTVFNNHLYRKIKRLKGIEGVCQKEGTHPIHHFYYFNFNRWDLSSLLSANKFRVEEVIGVNNFPRERVMGHEIKGFTMVVYTVDKLISRTPLSYLLGDLLLASVSKDANK